MSENTSSIVSKVWSFCNVLRDGGVSYGDYLEQLTYLIFLKMAEEYRKPPYNRNIGIPEEYTWDRLKQQRGAEPLPEKQNLWGKRDRCRDKAACSHEYVPA